jgi:hypothetical protein
MDSELIKTLASMGAGGIIASLIFLAYRKDMKQYTDLWQSQAGLYQSQVNQLLEVVRENTRSNEALIRLIELMSGRTVDRSPRK